MGSALQEAAGLGGALQEVGTIESRISFRISWIISSRSCLLVRSEGQTGPMVVIVLAR